MRVYTAMSDADLYEEEIEALCRTVRAGLDELPATAPEQRAERLVRLTQAHNALRQSFAMYRLELKDAPNPDRASELNQQIVRLGRELHTAQSAELMAGRTPTVVQNHTARTVIMDGIDVQKESLSAVARMAQLVARTEDVGVETAARLGQQREQIKAIAGAVDDVDTRLKRAHRIVRTFSRRLATDKCVIGFVLLLVAGIVFVIAWEETHKS